MFRGGGATRPSSVKYEDFEDVAKSDQFGKAPVQNDEAFMHGVICKAKFIGSMEVPRPKSRPDIISNMRRIRYEYKARNVVKVKVRIRIAVGGLTVTKRQKKKRRRRSSTLLQDVQPEVLLESPIYRVFFVSHDSLDRQIFSVVCRAEVENNRKCFICAVFKAYKKSHALRIVRTIGQVFDTVCRLQDTSEAKNIPGLLPPEKLQKIKEHEEKEKDEEETSPADEKALEALREAEEVSRTLENGEQPAQPAEPETTPEPLITFDDNYDMQVKSFENQQGDEQHAAKHAARLDHANQEHQTESADLMREFGLSVQQQHFLLQNYQVPNTQPRAGVAAGTGLPSPPAVGTRGVLPPLQKTSMNVTSNLSQDNSLLGAFDSSDGPPSRNVNLMTSNDLEFTGSPVDVYANPESISQEDSKKMLPRLFAMQRAQGAQIQLLQDQLSAETRQRVMAEAKVEHLLQQNKELADHVTWLVQQVKTHSGTAPQLPPTKRHIPGERSPADTRAHSGLNGFEDSFVLPPTMAISVQNGVPTAVSMPTKKPTSSDSESDSENEDASASVMTTASSTPYGQLGESSSDGEPVQRPKATSTPATGQPAAAEAAKGRVNNFDKRSEDVFALLAKDRE